MSPKKEEKLMPKVIAPLSDVKVRTAKIKPKEYKILTAAVYICRLCPPVGSYGA
jgi:hypothetical protein